MTDRIPLDSLTRDQLDALYDERDRLRATLAQFHDGEELYLDDRLIPTPGQWIWRWNRASSKRRLTIAGRLIADASQAARCFFQDHEAAVRERQGANRVRALHVRNFATGTCEHCSERDYRNYAVPYPCPTIQALDAPKEK